MCLCNVCGLLRKKISRSLSINHVVVEFKVFINIWMLICVT